MKRAYSKPEIAFENFSLSTNIAAGCELRTNLKGEDECGYPTRGGVVFLQTISGCKYTPNGENGDTHDGFCYHTPSDTNNLFNS